MKKFSEWIKVRESFRVSPSFAMPPDDRPEPPPATIDPGMALDGSDLPPVKKKKCNCKKKRFQKKR